MKNRIGRLSLLGIAGWLLLATFSAATSQAQDCYVLGIGTGRAVGSTLLCEGQDGSILAHVSLASFDELPITVYGNGACDAPSGVVNCNAAVAVFEGTDFPPSDYWFEYYSYGPGAHDIQPRDGLSRTLFSLDCSCISPPD